jgi:hypothetical protein
LRTTRSATNAGLDLEADHLGDSPAFLAVFGNTHVKKLFQQKYQQLQEEEARRSARIRDERADSLAEQILRRNRDLVDKFIEIALGARQELPSSATLN